MTKEQIENILGRTITDMEYDFFTNFMKADKEGKRLRVYLARRANGITRLTNEAHILKALIELEENVLQGTGEMEPKGILSELEKEKMYD